MNKDSALERWWVSMLNSKTFRGLTSSGVGRFFFQSETFYKMRLVKERIATEIAIQAQPDRFCDVETFCLIIGHNKSGTSMIGGLLDAHPEVILSDEVGALRYLLAGFEREQVFHLLVRGSRREKLKGRVTARRLTPYSYDVPGQWQGDYTRLRVIGDGKAGSTTRIFRENPGALARLRASMAGINLRFIQTIRNPFDPISVMMVRGKRSFENSINNYFANCDTLIRLHEQIGPNNLLPIRYEDFVQQPEEYLQKLAQFLGIEASPDYVKACMGILRPRPVQDRHMVAWSEKWVRMVEAKIQKYDFLEGYNFQSGNSNGN